MASTANAFDLLTGAEAALSSSKRKKKSTAQAGAQAGANTKPTAGSSAVPSSSGAFTAPSSGVVDVGEAVAILERAAREAKTIADKCKLWKDWSKQVRACSTVQDQQVSIRTDLCQLFGTVPGPSFQGAGRGGNSLKYRNADGSFADFKEVGGQLF
jgi:hypothetical protein